MELVNGKKISQRELEIIKEEIKNRDTKPSLAVVVVGNNPVSALYIKKKQQALESVGVEVSIYSYKEDISTEELVEKVSLLKEDGVIVQLPLPKSVDQSRVLNAIDKDKDVDMLSEYISGAFYNNTIQILPPVAGAVKLILEEHNINLQGVNTVVVGFGKLVGKPVSVYLEREGATVTVLNSKTKDISSFIKEADIVVSGVGSPGIIRGDMIKKGAVVIDAGTSSHKGAIKGDVDIDSVKEKASLLSPVPGGVGPLTICCLLYNLLYFHEH